MKIEVPSEEEYLKEKQQKRRNFFYGVILGIVFFGLVNIKNFLYGLEDITLVTWSALGIGVLSFGFLAYKFGDLFWGFFKQ